MSDLKSRNNSKLSTVADLENAAVEIENNLENMNKTLINKILKALNSIMIIVQRKEVGIFNVILKWFRLYLQIHISINPDDKIIIKYYEKTVPTVISYIIGCLQYNTKEITNYHLNLLEILEELLDNVQTKVLNQITNFEIGTIGCLWNPIDVAGDFNTQLKALKVLSILLKQFDETRQNEELKCIKWTNLNLFQDKLKTIVKETKLQHVMENNSRDLLNNYNMNLSKNILVYSFFCLSVNLGNKYKFYKPLNHDKFWIDINYRPQTLSYKARFKMHRNSKYEDINVILKIQMMKLENNILIIYFKSPGEFSKYSLYFSNISNNVIQFNLTNEERQRLKTNDYIMKYFNNLNKASNRKPRKCHEDENNTFDLLKTEMTTNLIDNITNKTNSKTDINSFQKCLNFLNDLTPEEYNHDEKTSNSFKSLQHNREEDPFNESPKSSTINEKGIPKHPIRKLRDRKKFFTSLIEENSDEETNKKKPRKRSQNKKPRQIKSCNKQVCKVTPTVDLTKMDNIKQNVQDTDEPNEALPKYSPSHITSQNCAKVLKQVADIYNANDASYAKPCQSYRNFKIESNPISNISNTNSRTRTRKQKTHNTENESGNEKKRKLMDHEENKENINPENTIHSKNTQNKSKRIISPHLFETQRSNETPPRNKLQESIEKDQNIEIDLTVDEIHPKTNCNKQNQENDIGSDCEEVRGLNEIVLKDIGHICTPTKSILNCSSNVSTPRPPSVMNVSDLNDSDMEITQIVNTNFLMKRQNEEISEKKNLSNMEIRLINDKVDTPIKLHKDFEILKEHEEIRDILNDFDYNSDEFNFNIKTPKKRRNFNPITKQNMTNNLVDRNYQRDCVVFQKRLDCDSSDDDYDITSELFENSKNRNLAAMEKMPLYLNQTSSTPEIMTTMATKYEVTPTAIIMHQIQVSAKKSTIYRRNNHSKVNRCLNNYYKSSSNQIKELRKDTLTLGNVNSKKLKETSSHTNTKILDVNKYNKTCQKVINRNSTDQNNKLTKLPITFHQHLKGMKYLNPRNTENDNFKSNENLFSNPPINARTDELFENLKGNLERSPTNISAEKFNNYLDGDDTTSFNFEDRDLENTDNSFKSDLLQIFNNYNTNMLNNAHEMCLNNMSNLYTRKFCEIAQTILKKSDEQRIELEQIRCNIGRLVRELQGQYDDFINKYKQFDVHKEITENVLDIITNMDIPQTLTKDYEELIKEIQNEQQEIIEKFWQKYLEKRKN